MDVFRYPSDDPVMLALQAMVIEGSSLYSSCDSATLLQNRIRNLRVTGVLRWIRGPLLVTPVLFSLCGCASALQRTEDIIHHAVDCVFDTSSSCSSQAPSPQS